VKIENMKAIIYARYSPGPTQTENSIEGQLREANEYAKRHNMKVVTTYIDRAMSGKSDDRPEFQRMIRDSAKKNFDTVLVWKLDRFARNRYDSATYRAVLKRNGVNVVSVKENISDDPEGILLESLLEGINEYYSAELAIKVKRGLKENALKCKANGAVPPFGYTVNAEKKADDEYILTHKLFCGSCGTMMVGTGGTSRTKQVYHYYKCGNNMYQKSCAKKAVKKDWIERLVVKMAQDYVLQDDVIDRLADKVLELFNKENVAIPFLKKQLAEIEKKINNLVDAIENGITSATTQRRLAELETKKEELEISIAKEQIEKPPLEKQQIVFWISRFKNGDVSDPKYRASIVDIFVNSVFLYDDELVVGFNWKDGNKTLSLKQWEKSSKGERASGSYLEQYSQFLLKPLCH